jgi:SAM-dependent methyltransferase
MPAAWRSRARAALPEPLRRWLSLRKRRLAAVPLGEDWAGLRRLEPVSRQFGIERGDPIDRFYIERFLGEHARDVKGRVLEIGDDLYTRRFGGNRVEQSDVLHAVAGNPLATLVGDLARPEALPADSFDCILCTQTLTHIFDLRGAVRGLHRMLRPGGVALVSVPGISPISRHDMERWGDFWRFTTLSLRRLFTEAFPADSVAVEPHGNLLASIAFLHGLAAQDLRRDELEARDPDFELLLTLRAVKPPRSAP